MLNWRVTKGRRALYWALQFLGWTAYFGYWEVYLVPTHNWKLIFVQWPVVWLSHLLGSHVLRAVIQGRRWLELSLLRAAWHLLIAIVLIDTGVQLFSFLASYLIGFSRPLEYLQYAPFYLFVAVILYYAWSGIYFGFEYSWLYRDAQVRELNLQSSLQQAELAALRSQVNPHFLFNCLNNVRSLIAEDPDAAREMLLKLSELLRHALDVAQIEHIPLEAELRVVEAYLELQQLQFEKRLRWDVAASEDSRSKPVPPMLLQQLVENAVKHGISKLQAGGEIHVTAGVAGRNLELCVENTGALTGERGTGVGLRNARERLQFMGGNDARLDLEQVAPNRVRARVLLPLGV